MSCGVLSRHTGVRRDCRRIGPATRSEGEATLSVPRRVAVYCGLLRYLATSARWSHRAIHGRRPWRGSEGAWRPGVL